MRPVHYFYIFSILIFAVLSLLLFVSSNKLEKQYQESEKIRNAKLKDMAIQMDQIRELQCVGCLTHVVYFDMHDDITSENLDHFKKVTSKLSTIEGVRSFRLGSFVDLKDERALSNYEFVMMMSFESYKAYDNYQYEPEHIKVKSELGQFLAAPPATYDFK